MEKLRFLFALFVLATIGLAAALFQSDSITAAAAQPDNEITAKRDLLCLMLAYPESIKSLERREGTIFVVMRSGKSIAYDDGKTKSYEQKLANADLQDMLKQNYPLEDIKSIPTANNDPGRIRCYAFLREVYGSSKSEVEKNLTGVSCAAGRILFNKNNQAARSLQSAFEEVSRVQSGEIAKFLYPLSGTYNYRCIAGTNQLSPHAFGIAIDLKSDKADYWRWATRQQGQARMDRYPRALVQAFENRYFIWGGKWAHFDFLHFEYRPELILKAKYKATADQTVVTWYAGFPDTPAAHEAIAAIDQALN